MATRKPLVRVGGKIRQLPAGDTLPPQAPAAHSHVVGDVVGLGTAAAKYVPASGDASAGQVVLGNDTRLTNARPASDVAAWAKTEQKPSYTVAEVGGLGWFHTYRDFTHGTLIRTNLPYTEGLVWVLDIQGSAHASGANFDTSAQGYVYQGRAYALNSISKGAIPVTPIYTVLLQDGCIGFWWPVLGYWHGFLVRCYIANGVVVPVNRVVGFSDAPRPAVTNTNLESVIPHLKTVLDDDIRLPRNATPAYANAAGSVGAVCWDSSYLYVCVATNSWKRVALSAW